MYFGWEMKETLQIGDRAKLGDRTGRIEFIGTTQFAPGEWIGLVLDGPHGKNDGSVNGVRYFTVRSFLFVF